MEDSFFEGDKTDLTEKEEVWRKFQKDIQVKEDTNTKSIFFTLLGNTVLKSPPFSKVTQVKRKGKISPYKCLRKRSHHSEKKLKIAGCDA